MESRITGSRTTQSRSRVSYQTVGDPVGGSNRRRRVSQRGQSPPRVSRLYEPVDRLVGEMNGHGYAAARRAAPPAEGHVVQPHWRGSIPKRFT